MSDDLLPAVNALAIRLRELAQTDPNVRHELRKLAQALLDITNDPAPRPAPVPLTPPSTNGLSRVVPPVVSPRPSLAAPIPPAPPILPEAMTGPRWAPVTDADLPLVESRCRLKAEAARWASQRRRPIHDNADISPEIEPIDQDIISRAKQLPDCFLWMCHPAGPAVSEWALYETLALCFEATAEALGVVRVALEDPDAERVGFERALDLLAEAQSMLRGAVTRFDGQTDADQTRTFHWLRATASEHQVFIRRFMRADDPADPKRAHELISRIGELEGAMQGVKQDAKFRRKAMGRVRHKVSVINSDPHSDHVEVWQELAHLIDEMITARLPPSNPELREILLPIIERLPDLPDLPANFRLVLREIDRYLATCAPSEQPLAVEEPSAEVREVARLLSGRCAIMIGGDRRPAAHDALREAFNLNEVFWIETREHQSIAGFESYVARDEVAVVFLAIRWSSHSFGEVKDFCDRYDKPLVRLPAGYNPNQVAVQVLAQCSGRLETA